MIINEKVWTDIKCRLKEKQIPLRKGHKWQAYFPEAAKVFKNLKGTAQAFMTDSENFKIIALPGPPSELESVLDEGGLVEWFKTRVQSFVRLVSWQCIGIPESELAYEVEMALAGCPFQVGYRASPPITEVKLWVDESIKGFGSWIQKMDEVCKPSLYSKNNISYIEQVLKACDELYFIDKVTDGCGLQEIKKSVSKKNFKKLRYAFGSEFTSKHPAMIFSKKDEDYCLEYEGEKLVCSLKGKKHAMLMLFKEYALKDF